MTLPILPERTKLGGLMEGLKLGTQQALPAISELIMQHQKQKQIQEAFPSLFGGVSQQAAPSYEKLAPQQQEQVGSQFGDLALQLEQQTGEEIKPEHLDQLWSQLQMPQAQQGMQQTQQAPPASMDDVAKALMMGRKDIADALMRKMSLDQKASIQERKEQRAERAETKDFSKTVVGGYEAAQISKANLDRMEKLGESGKLAGPWIARLSSAIDIPMSILANPESEEFEKLVAQRGINVAQAYGFGRILQTEYMNFLRTIPSLMNTQEGRDRITSTLRYFDNIAEKRYDLFKQIRKENKGRTPADIEEQVAERMEPEYESLRKKLVGTGSLTLDVMKKFLIEAPGDTKEEKIANAKRMAKEAGYS